MGEGLINLEVVLESPHAPYRMLTSAFGLYGIRVLATRLKHVSHTFHKWQSLALQDISHIKVLKHVYSTLVMRIEHLRTTVFSGLWTL